MELNYKKISVVVSLVALNIVIGSIVSFLKLPIYLDTIGIMLATLILGWRYGLLAAIIHSVSAFFLISPVIPFFIPTLVGLVALTEYGRSINYYSTLSKSTIIGLFHGVLGTIISAPIIYYMFGGFTASGNDMVTAYFVNKGVSVFMSVFLSLITFAVLDRIITSIFCWLVMKAIPKSFSQKNDFRYYKD